MSDAPRPVRALGDASAREERPSAPPPAPNELRARTLQVLQDEFAKALDMKHRLSAETGDADATAAKGKAIIASLEGANKLALKLGLIDVATSRELFAKAQADGLYEGWR